MFALLLVKHPAWNDLLRPVILDNAGLNALPLVSYLNGHSSECGQLTDYQKKIISVYDTTEEEYVMKRFVKEKMSKAEFQKKFSPSFPHYDLIMSMVEKANYKMALLAVENQVPVFIKDIKYQKVYPSDQVVLPSDLIRLNPLFSLKDRVLNYSLRLSEKGVCSDIPLVKSLSEVRVLSNSPACMVWRNRLYLLEKASFKKLSAFFTKKSVVVPEASLSTYMRTFVYKTLQEEDSVDAQGFKVERFAIDPQPILTLNKGLDLTYSLRLQFLYGDVLAEEDAAAERYVSLTEESDEFLFKVWERRKDKEDAFVLRLKKLGLSQNTCGFVVNEKMSDDSYGLVDFLIKNEKALSDVEVRQDIEDTVFALKPVLPRVSLEEVDMDWFELKGVVEVDGVEIPFVKLRNHIVEGRRIYEMEDGRSILLPEELFAQYGELLRRAEKGDRLLVRRSLLGILEDQFATTNELQLSLKEKVQLPSNINATLRDYQKVGYSWLMKLYQKNFGGCMADDMGLGKTLQFLTFFRSIYPQQKNNQATLGEREWCYGTSAPSLFDLQENPSPSAENEAKEGMSKEESKVLPSLIVVPTSLVFNWVNEKNKFVPTLTHYAHLGEKRIQSPQVGRIFRHYNLIITTYGILRNDIEYLKNCEFECVVFDESQALKNPSSQTYKSALQLQAKTFFCATGTPIENGMMDLWAQMNIANRNILGSANYFYKYFESPILKSGDEEREALLRRVIKPFILRRTKEEVAKELPEKYHLEVFCEMNEQHKSVYEVQKSAIRNTLMDEILRNGKPQEMTLALSSLTMLRQLSNQVSLVDETQDIPSTKVEEILRRLESLQEGGHKVLVFSSFVRFLEVIEEKIKEKGFGYSKITGSTKDREAQVEQFQKEDSIFCFLISLKAGGVGLNLTAADYVFLIDPWWNPAAEAQAEDRVYRIGQTRQVFVYRFIMKDTIEEKVLMLQNKKRSIADSFVRQNNPFETLDKSEWEDLFK